MALPPPIHIDPPREDPPLDDQGRHTEAWTGYHQAMSDRLAAVHDGVVDGGDARAGQVGEYLTASGGPTGLASATTIDLATLPLTAGDWEVEGNVTFLGAGGALATVFWAGLSDVSATLPAVRTQLPAVAYSVNATAVIGTGGAVRFSLAAGASAYLVARVNFAGGSMSVSGMLWARRVR